MQLVGVLCLLAAPSAAFESPKIVVNDISQKIADMMMKCGRKDYPKFYLDAELDNFWDPAYKIVELRLGCVAACSVYELKLCDLSGHLDEENIKRFIVANGADPSTVTSLRDVFRYCYSSSRLARMSCEAGLLALNCFRSGVQRLGWVPGDY